MLAIINTLKWTELTSIYVFTDQQYKIFKTEQAYCAWLYPYKNNSKAWYQWHIFIKNIASNSKEVQSIPNLPDKNKHEFYVLLEEIVKASVYELLTSFMTY